MCYETEMAKTYVQHDCMQIMYMHVVICNHHHDTSVSFYCTIVYIHTWIMEGIGTSQYCTDREL